MVNATTALVLAGGGVAGIAWELGVLRGLQEADPELAAEVLAADLVVGTSAGSSVAAQVTSGVPLSELYDAQLGEATAEIEVDLDLEQLFGRLASASAGAGSGTELRRRVGEVALAAETVPEAERLAAIAARLPSESWPAHRLLVPAVDATTGELRVFDADSGVRLVDAVAASCAVPGVWPPVTIEGSRYVDGGVRSGSNADLAAGCDRVLVVTPTSPDVPPPWGDLDAEVAALAPAAVHVVGADADSLAAFGTNPLSPHTRGPAARAGRAVGLAQAAVLRAAWSPSAG